jgi:hypothetical protein
MKKLLFVLCLALGGCASMPSPTAVKHHFKHHAPVASPAPVAPVVAPPPAPVEAPKPAKRIRWLDYFKKDKPNG